MTTERYRQVWTARARRFLLGGLLLPGLLLLGACRKAADAADNAGASTAPADAGIDLLVDRGPLRFRVHADKKAVDLIETLTLRVEAVAPEDVAVELPKLGAELGAFMVADYRTETPRLQDDGSMVYARTYVLDPLVADVYELPPLTARFTMPAEADGKAGAEHELTTDPTKIEVRMPSAEFWQQLDIDDTAELSPVAQLQPARPWWQWAVASVAGLLLLVVLLVVLWRRRRRRQVVVARVPPHVKALAALQALVAEDLVAKGDIEQFYHRISGILREYIEDRFGLRAPEQTTEEFMAALRMDDVAFSKQQRALLEDFLRHCDMVKFARHQPAAKEIQSTFDACKHFIVETTPAAPAAPAARVG